MSTKQDGKTVTGAVGSEPPAGAPREVSQPLSDRAVQEQVAKARANEKPLTPFVPTPSGPPAAGPKMAVAPRGVEPAGKGRSQIRVPGGLKTRAALEAEGSLAPAEVTDIGGDAPAEPSFREIAAGEAAQAITNAFKGLAIPAAVLEPGEDPDAWRRSLIPPAVLDPQDDPVTAEPLRGKPRPIGDPGKQITGGFGDVGETAYFALSGDEVRLVAIKLMDELEGLLSSDLRFSLAVTYPRVRVGVQVTVEGYGQEHGVTIKRVHTHDPTPLLRAEHVADEVCFVVRAQREEVDAAGETVSAPDAMRDELGIGKPRKRRIKDGSGVEHWIDQ